MIMWFPRIGSPEVLEDVKFSVTLGCQTAVANTSHTNGNLMQYKVHFAA